MTPARPDEAAPLPGFDDAALGRGLPPAVEAREAAPDAIGGDIPPVTWTGEPLSCEGCEQLALRAEGRCELGRSCLHDRYARRIDRFFRRNPELGSACLTHPYFEVRAIAARHADVFHLAALIDDPDETVRHSVAMRLPQKALLRLVNDPHREVRIRVAWRLAPEALPLMRRDEDYHVRTVVARRLPAALLPTMAEDPDDAVRREVAQRIEMPALLRLIDDRSPMVRRIVAQRLPAPLLQRLARDEDWSVRWEVLQRADEKTLAAMLAGEQDPELRAALRERLSAPDGTTGVPHG